MNKMWFQTQAQIGRRQDTWINNVIQSKKFCRNTVSSALQEQWYYQYHLGEPEKTMVYELDFERWFYKKEEEALKTDGTAHTKAL